MSKKVGKILLLGAAVSAAAAAAYYFLQKKNASDTEEKSDEDYDDFNDEEEDEIRSYVSLSGDETAPEASFAAKDTDNQEAGNAAEARLPTKYYENSVVLKRPLG